MATRAKELDFDPVSVRRYAEENFSLATMVQKYVDLYREIVRGDESQAIEGEPEERAVA